MPLEYCEVIRVIGQKIGTRLVPLMIEFCGAGQHCKYAFFNLIALRMVLIVINLGRSNLSVVLINHCEGLFRWKRRRTEDASHVVAIVW